MRMQWIQCRKGRQIRANGQVDPFSLARALSRSCSLTHQHTRTHVRPRPFARTALNQWKQFIAMVCSAEGVIASNPRMLVSFLRVLKTQLKQVAGGGWVGR